MPEGQTSVKAKWALSTCLSQCWVLVLPYPILAGPWAVFYYCPYLIGEER